MCLVFHHQVQLINKITINSNLGTADFGNKGKSNVFDDSLSYNQKIFQFPVPGTAGLISVGCYAKGSLKWGVQKESGNGKQVNILHILKEV